MSSQLDDQPNNWTSEPDYRNPDLYECERCGQQFPSELIDDDASQAFDYVCRECAEAERAQWAAEDAAERNGAAQARQIRLAFSNWWLAQGQHHWHDLLQSSLKRGQTLEDVASQIAELAWLAGAVKATEVQP